MRVTTTPALGGLLSLELAAAVADPARVVAEGQAVFERVCAACHYGTEMDALVAAPPILAVQHHYADFSDRARFVAAIAAYVRAPSEDASQMPWALDRFGLMPPQDITETEARAVAEFLYATDFTLPKWYIAFYLDEYGASAGVE